jgi:hypothetical protein
MNASWGKSSEERISSFDQVVQNSQQKKSV